MNNNNDLIRIKDLTEQQKQKLQDCYLKIMKDSNETIYEYYKDDPITLEMLIQIFVPLCTTTLEKHIDDLPNLSYSQKSDALFEVSDRFVGTFAYLIKNTINRYQKEKQ